MSTAPPIEIALEDAERKERRNGTAVAVEACRRRIVLNRFVVVGQVGTQPALEQRGQIHESRDRVRRRARDRSYRSARPARELARVARLL